MFSINALPKAFLIPTESCILKWFGYIFIAAGFGDADLKHDKLENKMDDFDDDTSAQIGYHYQMTDIFSVDTRYISSSSFSFKKILSFGLLKESIDYSVFTLSAQARQPITQNSYIYGNLGVARYNWEYATSKIDIDHSGFGGLFSLGYRYQWNKV
ncbi:hypothetical protein CJF42_16090 [Pseudoalteromonas sp. NBT06-2]|uniref:outer membrane beta-barrel protein n=1 Tax=Pseudoalteromonas sp. NBT06-2 TaxID=2025950 RepID=UPI000BA52950|nr:outer membrane beta-barrel protein [Pseudoalteromonas sp. NBT06-2]PAJ73384.1 hypothetical protein CJF42_16090 [Pseudoalteromonas sp. NBT06-2]